MKHFLFISSLIIFLSHLVYGQAELVTKSKQTTNNFKATFDIINLNNDTLSYDIYNRWGQVIISNTDTIIASGSYQLSFGVNQFPRSGTYYYIISTNDSTWSGTMQAIYQSEPTIITTNPIITDTSDFNLNILYLQSDTVTINVYDVRGEVIINDAYKEILYGEHQFTYSIDDFDSEDIYFVQVKINSEVTTMKIVVSNTLVGLNPSNTSFEPTIYPSPISNNINLMNFENVVSASLTSLNGESFWQGSDMSELKNKLESIETGVYILHCNMDEYPKRSISKKIIKR